jgi:YhcH/YjgK/YiaL family protein
MIYDKIDNLAIYAVISSELRLGLEYLRQLTPDVKTGVYELSPCVKAIVSEYQTKPENENGYEAHRDWIDIQYLLQGTEIVRCLPLEYLKETTPYDPDKDAAFFEENGLKGQELLLGNRYFTILFPHDGHMPCLSSDHPATVKKVVVKVKTRNSC